MKRILIQVSLLVLVVSFIALSVRKAEGSGVGAPAEPARSGLSLTALPQAQSDFCLQDNSNGSNLTFNSVTGAYTFMRCNPAFTLTGIGTVHTASSTISLTDSKPDRRVSAGFTQGQNTGTAAITFIGGSGVGQNFKINSTNPNAKCFCGK